LKPRAFAYIAGQGEIGAVTDHYFQQIKPLLQKYIVDQKHSSFPE
jgi:hypothetical protein